MDLSPHIQPGNPAHATGWACGQAGADGGWWWSAFTGATHVGGQAPTKAKAHELAQVALARIAPPRPRAL